MPDTTQLLRETRDRIAPPSDVLGSLEHRRRRRERVKRGSAVVVAFAVALAAFGGWFAVKSDTASMPVGVPSRDLGIFAGVRGWIAYGDPSGREPGVWAIDPVSPGAAPVLLDPAGGSPIAWSRDGSKLLIQRAVGDPDEWGRQRHELLVLHADGSETLVADSPRWAIGGLSASFSADGSQVIYTGEDRSIYSVPVTGGSRRLLYADDADGVYALAASPDGSRIAFFQGHGDAENRLWLMDIDGTDKRQVLGVAESGRTPFSLQWSPDGTRLAFSTGGDDRTFGVVAADGSGLAFAPVVVWGDEPGAGPYWSPDGTRLAFRNGPSRFAIAGIDGTVLQQFEVGAAGPWNPLEPTTTST
jgi:dipeptidyl aminopeptidase/acylaminoacyl peptidase